MLLLSMLLIFMFSFVSGSDICYWNSPCPYNLFSSKTPYDTVRGDLRDHRIPSNCEAVSIWSLIRHGNRNPGESVTNSIKKIAGLKDEIIASFEEGNSLLCAQDIEDLKRWTWNETLDESSNYLTGFGYEELHGLGKRLQETYPHLLQGSSEEYYFRPTNEQRTITSAAAFVHGFTEGRNLNVTVDAARERDDVIKPYANCERHKKEVRYSQFLEQQYADYYNTTEFLSVQDAVQTRLGIPSQLSADDIYSLFEICRFYRSWSPKLKSPWCAVFSDEDLVVLEYKDDLKHYYNNGYWSLMNTNLGKLPLKDLYETFEAATQGGGKKVTSYFTHDTMLEMTFCALGLFKDDFELKGAVQNSNRLWRTSQIGSFAVNIIAVLNRCTVADTSSYKVQFFINEKVTELCPFEGCTWEDFQEKLQPFMSANLDFCSLD